MTKVGRLALTYGTAAAVVTADQATKYLVVRNLTGRRPVHLVGTFIELRYATNTGGAFSLFAGFPLFFALMAAAVIVAIAIGARRAKGGGALVALGLLLGGAVGNLADRVLRGHGVPLHGEVVDFIAVWRWPVFNVADSCIVVGGILLALLLSRDDRRPAKPSGHTPDEHPGIRVEPGERPTDDGRTQLSTPGR